MNYLFIRHQKSLANITPSLYRTMDDHDIDICNKHNHETEKAVEVMVDLWLNTHRTPHIYHSPFLRAKNTKDIIISELAHHYIFPKVYENPLLVERSWRNLRDIIETEKNIDKYFNFFYKPINGESFQDCYQRCVTFDNMLRLKILGCDDTVIIVGHGEQIKCYFMHLLGWTVGDFHSYKNPKNSEVFLIHDNVLSEKTPLRKIIKN